MCCGRKRTSAGASSQTGTPFRPDPTAVTFEYVGHTAVTVVGPISGIRYRFDRPGARLKVDPRDRQGLSGVPVLRNVG